MSQLLRRFEANPRGRDLIVGDIHGCFTRLRQALEALGFDPDADRLFSVGDMVDRGPESARALEWLGFPWFHAIRGNHEQMAIDFARGPMDASIYTYNGGAWNVANTQDERRQFADAFDVLPLAIELQTASGLVGLVHANCAADTWAGFVAGLEGGDNAHALAMECLWSRERVRHADAAPVAGVCAVVVGHTPLKTPLWLGNVLHIDTGAVYGGPLTIVNAATLEMAA